MSAHKDKLINQICSFKGKLYVLFSAYKILYSLSIYLFRRKIARRRRPNMKIILEERKPEVARKKAPQLRRENLLQNLQYLNL